ncbi:hypothetical protein [Janthinobacterium sp. JC611]|uniref:hypothetical protein n=1 Tax=Janthinobacterium sp. JC611 TaxID=2816201 RepID=UPI001BFED4D7|nr:hypothetical protein [Janthinobacterium sp. JC611]
MSAIVGERDRMIMNTVPRFQPANDRVLLLAATAQAFKVAATTIATPARIDFTAGLINMQGQVAFSASNASVLTRVGNVASMTYGGMVGDSVTVTATIVVDGLTYTASQTVSKIFDGVTGNSARVAYSKTTLLSLASAPATISTQGDASFPPINTWGAGTVWEGSPQAFGAGESLYRSDGIFNPASGTTKWAAPYLNALKVGQLSAISADLGKVTAGDIYSATLHGGSGYPTSTYAWPSNGGSGFHLSESGLLFGNPGLGKYVQIDAAGNIYAPGFSIINGSAVFSGNLDGVKGTFSGELKAAKGTFSGVLDAAKGKFSGELDAVKGTFSGDLSSARVSVGTASAATAFFEPGYPSISLQSSASGVFVEASSLNSAAVFTNLEVLFKHNAPGWPAALRIRSGRVFFSIICTAVVDDQLSIWYRINGGNWLWMSGVQERQGGDGPAATVYGLTLDINVGDTVQFGVSGTNAYLTAADMGKLYVKQCQAIVIARNF